MSLVLHLRAGQGSTAGVPADDYCVFFVLFCFAFGGRDSTCEIMIRPAGRIVQRRPNDLFGGVLVKLNHAVMHGDAEPSVLSSLSCLGLSKYGRRSLRTAAVLWCTVEGFSPRGFSLCVIVHRCFMDRGGC